MASQSLYRKWRSRTFAEIVGQQRVTRTLQNALRTNRLSHAYLFCGSRGIGKTSAARVLAKAVNCSDNHDGEPCNTCPTCVSISEGRCLDIIEIDAASNRGIDEIRDLREKVNFAPSEATYKFYILDEVHMLTSEAFNALLKTLEEPPNHAVFVLVTTEPHRLPATILSRCQRFDFQRIGVPDLVARMSLICEAEGIEVESSALELIGRLSTGSLRDAESLLDQLVSYCGNKITLSDVHMVVGMTGSRAALELAGHLIVGDIPAGLLAINRVAGEGADLRQFCRETVECLRGLLVLRVGGGTALLDVTSETLREMEQFAAKTSVEFLVKAIRLFATAEASQRTSLHVQLPLELAFIEAVLPSTRHEGAGQSAYVAQPRPGAASKNVTEPVAIARPPKAVAGPTPARKPLESPSSEIPSPVVEMAEDESGKPVGASMADDGETGEVAPSLPDVGTLRDVWTKVIERCGQANKSLQAILRDCELVKVGEGVAELEFAFEFHKAKVEADEKNIALVKSLLGEVLGTPVQVKCKLRPRDKKKAAQWPMDDPLVKAAIEQHGARIKKVENTRGNAS